MFNLFGKKKRIYLDYASATPVLREVKNLMDKYWSQDFYNPSAIYKEGVLIKQKIEDARVRTARAVGVSKDNIIFTASGTESDNLAILGSFEYFLSTFSSSGKSKKVKPHIIVSAIEHPAVMSAAEEVVRRGGEMSVLDVDEEGLISVEALKKLIKKNTFLVSISLANGEIGTIQPISKIGRMLAEFRKNNASPFPYLHTDVSQALNYVNINIENLHVDMLTIDGSKIYGPKGIGLLATRKSVKIHPIIFGGGQEGGRRSGTLNPALVLGLALSLEIAVMDREKESSRLEVLRNIFIDLVQNSLLVALVNGSAENHLPNIVSISIPGILSEFVLLKLDKEGVMASVGSACSSDNKISGSYVIRAIGKSELAESTLRFSTGRFTTVEDIKKSAEMFCRAVSDY